jgi:hypothetical protein
MSSRPGPGEWVFLTYSLPRDPSAPRLALWRKLRRLGVAQLADGLVALPADARTREQLEWAADEVVAAAGRAGVWLARPTTRAQERDIAHAMNAARAAEYQALIVEAEQALAAGTADRRRVLRRLRAENHRIRRRDFFRPVERDQARQVIARLAASFDSEASTASANRADTTERGVVR